MPFALQAPPFSHFIYCNTVSHFCKGTLPCFFKYGTLNKIVQNKCATYRQVLVLTLKKVRRCGLSLFCLNGFQCLYASSREVLTDKGVCFIEVTPGAAQKSQPAQTDLRQTSAVRASTKKSAGADFLTVFQFVFKTFHNDISCMLRLLLGRSGSVTELVINTQLLIL